MSRFWRFVRSPRVAVGTLILLGAYCGLATAVPQEGLDSAKHAVWLSQGGPAVSVATFFGLDNAFSAPIFLAIVAVLGLSTAACSWSRTVFARRLWRDRGVLTEGVHARLDGRPDLTLSIPLSGENVAEVVRERLTSAGFKVRAGTKAGYAEKGAIGLFGSPVFHWSLAALMVVIAVGQLGRWEGLIAAPEGGVAIDEAAVYGKLTAGPLAAPHTGWGLRLISYEQNRSHRGVEYGWVPTVALVDGETELLRQRVYTNMPLRYGPLLIHYSNHGLSAVIEAADASGTVLGRKTMIFDFDDATPSGTTTTAIEVDSGAGSSTPVWLSIDARDAQGDLPRALPPSPALNVVIGDRDAPSVTVRSGARTPLPVGGSLRVVSVGSYARLIVVRDWSVTWIYLLMGLAIASLAIAMLVPYRAIWFIVEPKDVGIELRAVVRSAPRDHAFADAAAGILSGSSDAPPDA